MASDPVPGSPGTPVPPSAQSSDSREARELRARVLAAIGDAYDLGEEIGRGGMAVVYAARDVRLRRAVALKVLPPDMAYRGDVRARFVREAQTAARLNHPHIVPIYAVDEHDALVYFAMALVEGESLADVLKRESRPPIDFVGRVLEQVADALGYAHACGVVHRDIKPDNVLLDRESGRAVVTDFGIARAAESGTRLTQTGIAVGTPAFMSPEQATGDREVDGRSDIYCLGVVGYLMLAGRLPFEAASTPAMLIKHVTEPPIPIRDVRPDAPRPLVRVLERCLQKKPADRFEDARALRDAVREAMREIAGGTSMRDPLREVRPPHVAVAPPPVAAPPVAPPAPAAPVSHKPGTRAEEWAPRVPAPPAAPRGHVPPLDPNATSGEFRDWRRAVRQQKRDARERAKLEQQQHQQQQYQQQQYHGGAAVGAPWPHPQADIPLDVQVSRFQGLVLRRIVLMGGLVAINVVTAPFPWAIFPLFGISMSLVNDYLKLRERGVRWRDIFAGRTPSPRADTSTESKASRITREVERLRSRFKWLAGSAAMAVTTFTIGAGTGMDAMIPLFMGSVAAGVVALPMTWASASRLRRLGVSLSQALGSGWKAIVAAPDERPREIRLAEEIARVAGDSVMRGKYGQLVRESADDRLAIRDASSRLSEADRSLVPDVGPTADALFERIGAAASALERLDHDMPTGAVRDLEARIAAVEQEPEHATDRERRLTLLRRQRASLEELDQRRTTLKRQIDNASMALRSLRLDMVKLRTLGVGAAIEDVNHATQEARALSIDIGRAIEVADEVRKI